MSVVEAADITEMTAQDSRPANNPIAQQQLWRQCSRIVLENNGTITVSTASGAPASSQEKSAFTCFVSPTNPGAPVIIFNVSERAPLGRPQQLLHFIFQSQRSRAYHERCQSSQRYGDREPSCGLRRRRIQ